VAISTITPSEYPGVTRDRATGVEKIRCFPGIQNSNTSELSIDSGVHFFDFFIFLE